jgi:hypothetical protein
MKFDILNYYFENLSRKFNFYLNLTEITDTVREDDYKILIISPSILLGMRNISDNVAEKIKTHLITNNFFFFCENISFSE